MRATTISHWILRNRIFRQHPSLPMANDSSAWPVQNLRSTKTCKRPLPQRVSGCDLVAGSTVSGKASEAGSEEYRAGCASK